MPSESTLDSSTIDVGLLLHNVKEKFNLTDKDIADLSSVNDVSVPIGVFSSKLGCLESISLYLRDELKLSVKVVATLLKRDYKTIYASYSAAKKKVGKIKMKRIKSEVVTSSDSHLLIHNLKEKFNLSDNDIQEMSSIQDINIPISIFNKKLGCLESISVYLRDNLKLSYKVIARLLERDYKTVYTSYSKAKKKKE